MLSSIKVYLVFALEKLRKDPGNPLPGQKPKPAKEVNITGDVEYEVEKVLGSRLRTRILEYRV